MTRPLSSPRSSTPDKPRLVDASGRTAPLGESIGTGGEGRVFAIDGVPGVAAKVYHKPPVGEHAEKLRAMCKASAKDLAEISAWPRGLLFDPGGETLRGVLMPRIIDALPLHELYGTTGRERHFPHAQWGHLVLAARNTAAAFDTLHSRGVVVGDVNQGNLLVDKEMCVRFIDCDSFQLRGGGRVFRCPVGTPHFTPPELQSLRLGDATRTPDHDAFGLAILVFHLLFVGRHPFAGRFLGEGDLTIEKAIAQRRFAFSLDKAATQVEPPPATLRLEDLPPALGRLFEGALRRPEDGPPRPTPAEWVDELERLLRQRKECPVEEAHAYYGGAMGCPWCRIEEAGGPSFFMNAELVDGSTESRLAALDTQLNKIRSIHFPELPSKALRLPTLPLLREGDSKAALGPADIAAHALATGGALSLVGAAYLPLLAAGAGVSALAAAALLLTEQGRSRRRGLEKFDNRLHEGLVELSQHADRVERSYLEQKHQFDNYSAVVSTGMARYATDTENLQTIMAQLRQEQKDEFLGEFRVRDYRRRIRGLEPAKVVLLESYGVESARQIDKLLLTGVPMIDPPLQLELLEWRKTIEAKFKYKPDAGLSEREIHANQQEATRRFKVSQARKVLAGAKRLRAMVHAAKQRTEEEQAGYDRQADRWRELGRERQRFQAARSWLERTVNRGFWEVVALGAAGPVVGLLAWFLFG